MLTLNDIINVSFRKAGFSGYRTEDVDSFIDQVRESFDTLIKKTIEQKEANEALSAENAKLNQKLDALAEKIEGYRKEEDEIKTALVSAQKLGEASVREARHKAEIILKDANLKAERIIGSAKTDVVSEKRELEDLKKKVSDFRSNLLAIYKEHLTLIDAIPAKKDEPEAPEEQPVASEPETDREPEEQPQRDSGVPEDFSVDASSFETPAGASEKHDLRYDVLKFNDDDLEIDGD
ncbi:MAG TPA: cell division protein DivIVA [Ruminococcaceae bacterium]|nr:cell division protein DivIVA [Oscillospiraceae bacterium]